MSSNLRISLVVSVFLLFVSTAAAGAIIYVDGDAPVGGSGSSWTDAYNFLQDALAEASSLGTAVEIRVAQGIYNPDAHSAVPNGTGDRTATFQLINGVILKGGYAGFGQPDPDARNVTTHETVLSGDLNGNDLDVNDPCDLLTELTRAENSYHVVKGDGTDATAVLDGFTITGGNANWDWPIDPRRDGGGMYCGASGSPTVIDCTFRANTAGWGAGMYIRGGQPKVVNCTFVWNAARRHAGALLVEDTSTMSRVTSCTFIRNSAGWNGGAVWNNDAHPTYVNCTFSGNVAGEDGGAMWNVDSSWYTLINCTLIGNQAQQGGAIDSDCWPILTNCILWGNRDSSGTGESAQVRGHYESPAFNYCCIEGWTGGWGGTGNTGSDPCFVQPGFWDASGTWVEGDYHLLPASRCIDAGDNNSVPADTTDLDGDGNTAEPIPWDLDKKPRIVDSDNDGSQVVDMGAYERCIIRVDADANGTNNGTSWADAFNCLQDALAAAGSGNEIWVAQGIYKPDQNSAEPNGTGGRTATFRLISGVILKGGYAGFGEPDPDARHVNVYETILSGDLEGNDVDLNGSCDLLTEPNRDENSYHVVTGSGTDETAVLDGFTITAGNANGNYPSCDGGGMYNKYGGSPTVVNCTFLRNSARVRGGAMHIAMYSDPVLINCAFIGNSSKGGGAVYSSGGTEQNTCEPMLLNCVFSGNSATARAGGMDNHGRSTLIGCTFSGNSAKSGVGGMFDFFGRATLTNCILWGNTGDATGESAQIHTYDPYIGDTDINYCCIQGWTGTYGGVGNIGDDPLFVDADGGDNVFGTEDDNPRLLPGSSCLDAGDNNSVPTDSLDLDGDGDVSEVIPFDIDRNQRFIDEAGVPDTGNGIPPIVDIGAYESINQGFLLSTQSIIVPEGGTATFTVAIAIDPNETVAVNVAVALGDPDIAVESGASLTFDSSNYFVPQGVTLTATEDRDNLHGAALIQIIAEGFAAAGVSAGEEDNDPIPAVLYVDADAPGLNDGVCWEDAYIDLQDAMSIAMDFPHVEEIRVANGVYRPAGPRGDREATFQLINGVTIKGGYAGFGEPDPNRRDIELYETILSGDLNGNDIEVDDPLDLDIEECRRGDNSRHVVTGSGTDGTAVLDGFIVTAGCGGDGAGMYNENGSPMVINCAFSWNGAAGGTDSEGSGMFNHSSNPTVVHCAFKHNAASWPGGGGMCNEHGSSPTLINCLFIGNKSGGFDGGKAGAMRNWEGSSPTLINCLFVGNYAQDRAGAIRSGGNYVDTVSSPTLVNCTFVGNSAGQRGGAIIQRSGTLTLTNCIMWDNTAPEGSAVYLRQGYQVDATVTITYSDVEAGQSGFHVEPGCTLNWGDGNIDTDPCFVDATAGDYHLAAGSPCIDVADNASVPADMTDLDGDGNTAEQIPWDLDGNPRIVDGDNDGSPVVDMGAYEFFVPPIEVPMKFTPQALNPASQGNWVKAHLVLPEGFAIGDVDTGRLAQIIEPFELECDNMNVFVNENGLVEVEAAFDRGRFCGNAPVEGNVSVVGFLTSGRYFCGTDTIRIIDHSFKCLAGFASYWLEGDCSKPDWCGGLDLNQDSEVNLVDFALFDGCCIEIISE